MEIITYILGNPFHFVGFIVFLIVTFIGIVQIIEAIKLK